MQFSRGFQGKSEFSFWTIKKISCWARFPSKSAQSWKMAVFGLTSWIFEWSRFFPGKPPCAFLTLIVRNIHAKNQKNPVRGFPEKQQTDGPKDELTIPSLTSTDVENCSALTRGLNVSQRAERAQSTQSTQSKESTQSTQNTHSTQSTQSTKSPQSPHSTQSRQSRLRLIDFRTHSNFIS